MIVGYGIVPSGHVADLPFEINNANFEKVEEKEKEKKA